MTAIRMTLAAGSAWIALAGLAAAADFETPVTLPPGSKLDVAVTRTRSGSGIAEPMTITFRYRQDIRRKGDGYLVRQRRTAIVYPPEVTEAEKLQVNAMSEPMADFSYDADEALTPMRIIEWQKLLARLSTVGTDEETRNAFAVVGQMYSRLTPEAAATSLLREQLFPAAAQGTSLDLKKPVSEAVKVANPLGGVPIDGVYAIELESLDQAAGRAVIHISSKLDPESAKRSGIASIQAMLAAMPTAPKPTAEQLAAIKIDRLTECRHQMDLKTGLALISDCTMTVTGSDETLKPRVQVDRWFITQTVVRD
jgi:hypothetical protein